MNACKPIALVILDGFGYRKDPRYNAIQQAHTPQLDFLFSHYPHALLEASGTAVGLLPGTMGNSEVGHLTIGAGRIIPQPMTRLYTAIQDASFFENKALQNLLHTIQTNNSTLHIMGLLSDAGVHSTAETLYAFLQAAHAAGLKKVIIHPFLDGRDTPPQSAATYLAQLEKFIKTIGIGTLGSLHGRWYAMDRDNNWERTLASYTMLTAPEAPHYPTWQAVLEHYYAQGITDEFIPPTLLANHPILDNDGVVFFNYRPDRARQLTRLFLDPSLHDKVSHQPKLAGFLTPFSYGLSNAQQTRLFETLAVPNTLKEVLSRNGKTIFTIAETEKYAHVTYFFCGGKEEALPHEIRILIPSLHVKTYIDHPAMSAQKITETVQKSFESKPKDFYLINYANADMVGHSGNFEATVQAIECLDEQITKLYETIVDKHNGILLITADHGNAEIKADPNTGKPLTSHTTSPVPFIHIEKGIDPHRTLPLHSLADIAPYILSLEKLPIPTEMIK